MDNNMTILNISFIRIVFAGDKNIVVLYIKSDSCECSEVTFYLRPFIFYGIPMLLIRLHGDILRIVRRRWVGS